MIFNLHLAAHLACTLSYGDAVPVCKKKKDFYAWIFELYQFIIHWWWADNTFQKFWQKNPSFLQTSTAQHLHTENTFYLMNSYRVIHPNWLKVLSYNFVNKWFYKKMKISHSRKFIDVYLLTRKILNDTTIGMHTHFAFYAKICQNDSKWLS